MGMLHSVLEGSLIATSREGGHEKERAVNSSFQVQIRVEALLGIKHNPGKQNKFDNDL